MKKGYTLVELLTGIAIFLMVVFSATGVLISAFRAQRKALALREIIDSTSYTIDYMSRAIRMAKKDDVEIRGDTTSCFSEAEKNYKVEVQGITFRTYKLNECQSFFLDNINKRIKERKGGSENFITPGSLEVTNLKFFVSGDESNDNLQPRVTIFLEIQKKGDPATKISLQTTVSQRDLDF